MTNWQKLHAIYTSSTKPDPCNHSILLNADFLNFYPTLDLLQIAHIWCQSEEGILSQQLSCLEATARHLRVVWRRFCCVSTGRCPGSLSTRHRRFPGARERCEKCVIACKRLCPCTGYILSTDSDNFEPICYDN